ncbi:MAG: hypothetical protein GYB68_11000 [Chloroflexi bacterium]|nr:hypothetical protein [Chloroflexota bacterium]
MKTLSQDHLDAATTFIKAQARPVDLALYAFYFEDGTASAVLDALSAYQNEDGGFGHGIEPDIRLSESSPMASSVGMQYAVAVDAPAGHPLIVNAMDYLVETFNHEHDYWPEFITLAINDEPHAPWWSRQSLTIPTEAEWSNPSAELTGYLNRYASLVPPEELAEANQKAQTILSGGVELKGYDILCWQRCLTMVKGEFAHAIQVRLVDTFKAKPYGQHYRDEIGVLWLAPTPDSILAKQMGSALDAHLDDVIDQQAQDGAWWPTWEWGMYADAWQIARVEWAGKMTVETLHGLKAHGRLP